MHSCSVWCLRRSNRCIHIQQDCIICWRFNTFAVNPLLLGAAAIELLNSTHHSQK